MCKCMEKSEKNPYFCAMKSIRTICIYGASSEDIPGLYKRVAVECGRAVAGAGARLVCGGGKAGLMRCAIDGALECGGAAIGVLPQFMADKGWGHPGLTQVMVTPDMHSRKSAMASLATGVIALPGGVGTLEELLEIITWRKLNLYHGNVVILNVDGFFTPLLQMLERTVELGFMHPEHRELWQVAADAADAVNAALRPDNHGEFGQTVS